MTWATPYKVIEDDEGTSYTLVIANEDDSPFLEKIKVLLPQKIALLLMLDGLTNQC